MLPKFWLLVWWNGSSVVVAIFSLFIIVRWGYSIGESICRRTSVWFFFQTKERQHQCRTTWVTEMECCITGGKGWKGCCWFRPRKVEMEGTVSTIVVNWIRYASTNWLPTNPEVKSKRLGRCAVIIISTHMYRIWMPASHNGWSMFTFLWKNWILNVIMPSLALSLADQQWCRCDLINLQANPANLIVWTIDGD